MQSGNSSLESLQKKTVFELIITKEFVPGIGWQYVPYTQNNNLEENYTLEEALSVIAASTEISNLFVKKVFARVLTANKREAFHE